MMGTVLLRLSAPLQSYGTLSRWEERATTARPTKSAVLGLVANALGLEHGTPLTDLAELTFTVRADRPGHLLTDQQTTGAGTFPPDPYALATDPHLVQHPDAWTYAVPRKPAPGPDGVLRAPWQPKERRSVLVTKHYLADAAFIAGLTGDAALVRRIDAALHHPARLLYLGRRCCPPDHPVAHGTTPDTAADWPNALPLLPRATTPTPLAWTETPPATATTLLPEGAPTSFTVRDHPVLPIRAFTTSPPPHPETTP
ncbi:type I-E CRISPR-associated protein Cas5/CasD [Streptomyces sp. CAU 1734]|uniref:type I-E CRISPR-associated protein Cas5/CasD n=1 Tax=Streptomyces sp. CAU 1734 TaxID=3140360 RepID=UPI003261789C